MYREMETKRPSPATRLRTFSSGIWTYNVNSTGTY